jgi:hypothetical protein
MTLSSLNIQPLSGSKQSKDDEINMESETLRPQTTVTSVPHLAWKDSLRQVIKIDNNFNYFLIF